MRRNSTGYTAWVAATQRWVKIRWCIFPESYRLGLRLLTCISRSSQHETARFCCHMLLVMPKEPLSPAELIVQMHQLLHRARELLAAREAGHKQGIALLEQASGQVDRTRALLAKRVHHPLKPPKL